MAIMYGGESFYVDGVVGGLAKSVAQAFYGGFRL
jgi:hypothetical protein